MITADQLLIHAIGDYLLQSDWMANEKTKRWAPCAIHAIIYGLPFLFLTTSWKALAVIIGTHYLIDRYRLARYVVWVKNFLAPRSTIELGLAPNTPEVSSPGGYVHQYMGKRWHHPWSECAATGYHRDRPAWMAVWLMIIADNVLHVLINGLALKYL
jgi:hypothetical protein